MFSTLKINHKSYQSSALKKWCNTLLFAPDSEDWQKELCNFILEWIDPEDYIVAQTSGSTGKPKQIRISKSHMIYSAQTTCRCLDLKAENTALLCLPTRFIGGKMMVVRAFVCGLDLIPVPPSLNPFSKINQYLDFAALTPLQCFHSLQKLKTHPPGKIIIGGGEISTELESHLAHIPSRVYSTYGMTETSSHIAMRKVNGDDRSCYFRVLGSTVIDTDQRGCLVISNPDLIDSEMVTNDMVEIINEKEFKWLGRWDHVINTGGIKLIAEDMEKKIAHLLSSKMLYVPLSDRVFGEIPVLVVEKEVYAKTEKEKLFMQIKSIIGKFAVPKHILTVKSFPLTGSGKIDRIRLREMVQEKIKDLGKT